MTPTLIQDMIDSFVKRESAQDKQRYYMGMSGLGRFCERAIVIDYKQLHIPKHGAHTYALFEAGHRVEAVLAGRLISTPGVTLTYGNNNCKLHFSDFNGYLQGNADGIIKYKGQTSIWECKGTQKLPKEGTTLEAWNSVYYSQAQLYMHYSGIDHHITMVSDFGAINQMIIETAHDSHEVRRMQQRAERLLTCEDLPEKIGGPTDFLCKMCGHYEYCHAAS